MPNPSPKPKTDLLKSILLFSASYAALQAVNPIYLGEIDVVKACTGAAMMLSGAKIAQDGFWRLGNALDALAARIPEDIKASAGWAKNIRALTGLNKSGGSAPYWGHFKKGFLGFGTQAIYADFINTLVLGVSGSGKDTTSLQPLALSLAGQSKTITCLKGDTYHTLGKALEKFGERVVHLNIGGVFDELESPKDTYSPMDMLCDDYDRAGGLKDITSDVTEMTLQLDKLSKNSGEGNAKFFNFGNRRYAGLAMQAECLVKGRNATLGGVLQLLNDRDALTSMALWMAGRLEQEDGSLAQIPIEESHWASNQSSEDLANYKEHLRGEASGVADELMAQDTRNVDSFLAGARQALGAFNITTRAHQVTKSSSFRFAEQKEDGQAVTVILTADSSRLKAQQPIMEMIQFCMLNEWKRHPNKQKPVYFLANECTNIEIYDLQSLLTWGRAYSIKLVLFIQSISAFRKTYGADAVSTLLSETDAKLILKGLKEPEALKMVSAMLGDKPIMKRNYSAQTNNPFELGGYTMQEESRPLKTPDEIRRIKKTIFVYQDNFPAQIIMTSIASIWPFRRKMGNSPYFNKPYLLRIKLCLWRHVPWTPQNILRRFIKTVRKRLSTTFKLWRKPHA